MVGFWDAVASDRCFIVYFSSTTFAFVPLIIGRQLVELCVFLATCH